MNRRGSGILMHVSSLPSAFGIGDLGGAAERFVDFLAAAGQSTWQILPLSPTALTAFNDPYHSISAFAGNPLLISPELLVRDGLLTADELDSPPDFPVERVDFAAVTAYRQALLARAYERFTGDFVYELFCDTQSSWLDDYALFVALKARQDGAPWHAWPPPLRDREPPALAAARDELRAAIDAVRFQQFLFDRQWRALRAYARERGVQIFGDMPIYVDHDSTDVWQQPGLWQLDDDRQPTVVAGVPPDYFSATGQLWKSPIYAWPAHLAEDFDWWLRRIARNLELYDLLRIDHFRGLVAYWEVPAGEATAVNGRWVPAPMVELSERLIRKFPGARFVAEDLGFITPEVREVKAALAWPGMKILQFAFGADTATHPDAPHNYERDCWAYTGTHDNNPVLGWLDEEASPEAVAALHAYLGRAVERQALPWEMLRLLMASAADRVVVPVQDLLGLGAEARMNRPGHLEGNWGWRLGPGRLTPELGERLLAMTRLYGRC